MKWFERQFKFDFPVALYPNVIERLRGTPARLEELIRSFPVSILTSSANGGWSIQEQVGHLSDLEILHGERLNDFTEGRSDLRPADLENKRTHRANHNASGIDDILNSFRTARSGFVQRLVGIGREMFERSANHPRLSQPMRLIDMIYFVAEHDDHHLAIITALAKEQKSE